MKIYEKLSDNTFAELDVDNSDGLFYGECHVMDKFCWSVIIIGVLILLGIFISTLFN